MKIILASDWHIGLTNPKHIEKLIKQIALNIVEQDIKALVFAGDFCGGQNGYRSVRTITNMFRQYIPNLPILVTLGNHDYWCGKNRKRQDFKLNYAKIVEVLQSNKIHFLDLDGPYRFDDGVTIVGHTMWYQSTNPPTNDGNWIPNYINGSMFHHYLSHALYYELDTSLQLLTPEDTTRVFVSHFPVRPTDNARDWQFAGPEGMYKVLKEEFNFTYFLWGHTHRLTKESNHYCVDSDYCKPKYMVVDII